MHRGKVLPQHGGGDASEETKKSGTEEISKSKGWVVACVLNVSPPSLSVSAPRSCLSVFLCVIMGFKWQDHISVHAVNSLPLIFVPRSKLSLFLGGGRKPMLLEIR